MTGMAGKAKSALTDEHYRESEAMGPLGLMAISQTVMDTRTD